MLDHISIGVRDYKRSGALADAARQDARAAALLADFTSLPAQALRNRAEAIDLLVLGRAQA